MAWDVPILENDWVRLEPLAEGHRDGLRVAADDPRIWQHMLVDGAGSGFDPWFDDAIHLRAARTRVPFAVRTPDGRLVGSTSFLDTQPFHRRVEIGATWYHPDVWATRINPACKLLLLTHAIEVLGLNRVSFVVDLVNARSQAAVTKLGAVREGVLRSHMISRGGRIRDSVFFSVLAAEWPGIQAKLQARLAPTETP